ncbi:uncharacterized protein rab44 isoform X2 [Plectropomus leopardus]|uniref:uncharacterized protein rab44 isoform X2 n=1 Tax=Plectropomus leopardus TaxID=160734 RepID=UPI001C4B65D2|nr:uncharacterized protein rab44 isoform X2 [Plectropomus leopardus]
MQEMPQILCSPESVKHEATENSEIIFGNLTDQTEVSDTHQSLLIVKINDDSPTNQEPSSPDSKLDEHTPKEHNSEVLEQKNEDYHVYDTKKPPIRDIDTVDTALNQVSELEGRADDDTKPAEQTGHQEKEGLFSEMEESESSLKTLQSEINVPLDSQHQQKDTEFNPLVNRRKLGSSRRNKGRRHVKDSTVELYNESAENVVGNTKNNEPFETTEMSTTSETAVQEKIIETMPEEMHKVDSAQTEDVGDQVEENAHAVALVCVDLNESSTADRQKIEESNFVEILNEELPNVSSEPEKEREEDTELLRQDENVQTNYSVSEDIESSVASEITTDKHNPREQTEPESSVEQEISSSTKQELPTDDEQTEIFSLSEVKGDHKSEDAVNTLHEIENSPTQMQEMHQTDYSTKRMEHYAIENFEVISGNLTDQTEASDTHQSEMIVKSADDSPTNQDMLNPDDKQEEHHTKDNNFKALEQKNEDYHDFDTNKPLISDIDRGNAALGQVSELEGRADNDTKPAEQTGRLEKEGLLSEMEESESSLQTQQSEINAPFDSQYQQKDTVFKLTGNRRKLGSSRRNKGGQRLKDSAGESYHRPTEDFVGNTTSNEPLETTEMTLTTDTAVQEERNETMLEGKDKFDTVQTEDVRDKVKDAGFDLRSSSTADQQIINQSNFREKPNDKLPNVSSVPKKESKERDADPELLRQDVNLQSNYFVSESHVESGEIEFFITPEKSTEKSSQREHTDIECSVEQAASLSIEKTSANEEQTEPRVRAAHHSEDAVDEVHEEEVKATQMQEMHQTDNSANKETGSSLQAQQSEMNAPLDSHLQDDSQSIKEQTHTGFKPTGNRRKLGSSRRNKGRLHVEDTTKISLIMETTKQEELKEQAGLDFSSTGELGKIRSSVNDDQNTEKMLVEDTILSKNVMDISSIVTTDITSESGKDDFVKRNKEVNDEEDKHINEPESLSQLTGCDTVKTDLITSPEVSVWKDDSDKQSVSYHDENIMARSIASDVLEQEEALRGQNKETLSCDKEINMQCTNDTRGESLMYERVSGQREDGEQFESHKSKEINVLPEITPAKLFSHKTDAPSDADLEENFRVDVSEESGISSQQAIQEKMHLDDSENLQVGSKQKRRKMGSTRRTQLNRKPEEKRVETNESDLDTDTDMRNLVKMEAAEELQMIEAADVSQNENAKPSISPASHNEQVVNLVKFVQGADVRDSERNADVGVEPQKDDFTATDTVDITSELTGRNSIDVLLSANTEDTNIYVTDESVLSSFEITQRMQNNEERPESVNVTKDQTLKSAEAPVVADLEIVKSVVRGGAVEEHMSTRAGEQEPDNVSEGAHNENLEMNASPNLGSTSRRRKLGSTRKNLGSRTNRVDLHRKHDVDDEATDAATNVGREKTKSSPGIIEDDLQPHTKHKDGGSDERKDTVEYSHTGESQENPDSRGQLVETEHQIPSGDLPAVLSTPPKHDFMSEAASRRKRKLGSHRKSHGHQSYESQTAGGDRTIDAQNEKDVTSITDQSGIRTTEELKRESVGLDKISEVDESDKEPSANISKEGEHSRPASAKPPESETPVQHRFADIRLGQESQKTFSLGNSEGADLRSNALNVMMIGDSSVGKTSFIKRAQSGKFSLDIPPSIGLDSCKWTVLVDGKPVVLQLWDTAGQERFHSITRQIFHKAQAFLLMYDITSSQSFSAVSYWASCIQEGAAENVTVLLVGNKSDCAERQVKTQEAEILAKEYNFEFTECSAATGENVVQSLETVARMLSQKDDTREEAMVFHKEPQKKKSSRCC